MLPTPPSSPTTTSTPAGRARAAVAQGLLLPLLLASTPAHADPTATWGHGGASPKAWALRDARIIVAPGKVLEHATLLMRQGRIEQVGEHVTAPPDARVLDLHGKTLHAGFIDPYVTTSRLEGQKSSKRGPYVDPEDDEPAGEPEGEKEKQPAPPHASSANHRIHADWRVADLLKVKPEAVASLREQGFTLVQGVYDHGIFRGQAALYSLIDGTPSQQLLDDASASVLAFELGSGGDKGYPGSMMGNVAVMRQTLADARWLHTVRQLPARALAGLQRPALETSLGALWPVLDGRQALLVEAESLLEVLRLHRVLDEAQVARRLTVLSGEEWRRLEWLRPLARRSGWVLPIDFPHPIKARSQGEWNEVSTHALEAWHNAPSLPRWLSAMGISYSLSTHRLEKVDDFGKHLQQALKAGLDRKAALAALTTVPAQQLGISDRFGTLEPGKAASLVVESGDLFDPKSHIEEVWVEGTRHVIGDSKEPPEPKGQDGAKKPASKDSKAKEAASTSPPPAQPPPPPASPVGNGTVLVRNATVWTQGPQGVLTAADLLVVGGRIQAVGHHLQAPASAQVVDGKGLHVTPGIIDAHSHTAVDGSVNESLSPVSAQVRIKDVINPFDLNIYRQLAGGVTTANVLHGSANTIGGQVVTCKWRWGSDASGLLLQGAPEGIKMALGENPRHANSSGPDSSLRYPRTRMGVAELIRERFAAARAYRAATQAWQAGKAALPPRPDLQLEALLEILDGKRLIHCHSYRQDEILALLRIAEQEGFKIQTFQHVLEGYKVADEIAKHGAMASTFSDWWAYKMEVMDAIPYNGALLHLRGVVTSFNSDSDEQARRLNTEAAKAVRYGNLREAEALAFVTSNPARQLGVAHRIGSLEPGKDGDFVLWSGHPLSQRSVALQTWIEGRRYFDRDSDQQQHKKQAAERARLLTLAREAAHAKDKDDEEDKP